MDLTGYIPGASIGTLLALAVWLILTGRLVPRSHLDESRGREDMWRETAQTALAATGEMSTQVGQLADVVRQLVALHQPYQPPPYRVDATGRHHRSAV